LNDDGLLGPEHFDGDVVEIARDLIGRRLIVRGGAGIRQGVIIETEAYAGVDDPASHAAFRPGGRAATMFGPPGIVYVYAAYGMYPCLNIVTGPEGTPAAVLLRGVHLDGAPTAVHGPGRLTRAMGVTLDDHGATVGGGRIAVGAGRLELAIAVTPRVGVTRGSETPWRFVSSLAASEDR
jgi:DNA-3-methyladenine glycosylase